jgi:hypothetical protein
MWSRVGSMVEAPYRFAGDILRKATRAYEECSNAGQPAVAAERLADNASRHLYKLGLYTGGTSRTRSKPCKIGSLVLTKIEAQRSLAHAEPWQR